MKSWRSLSVNAALAGFLLAALPADAAPLTRAAAQIDVAGAPAIAAHLRRAIPHYLAQELAANPIEAPAGARLIVRVTTIFLSNDLGSGEDGGMMMDALDGEALIVDARGAVLARKNVTGRMPPSGNLMDTANEPRRVDALAQSIAYWTVRELR